MKKLLPILFLALFITGCSVSTPQSTMSKNTLPTSAIIQTSLGDISLKLFADKAPRMVENFTELAKAKKYDNTIFHRIIQDFMIQAGDYENFNGTGGASFTGKELQDEFGEGLSHKKGTVSMANRGPNTNGSQFFIVTAENGTPWLDGKHSIFAEVSGGMDVVEKIESVETDVTDAPLEPLKVLTISVK